MQYEQAVFLIVYYSFLNILVVFGEVHGLVVYISARLKNGEKILRVEHAHNAVSEDIGG